MNKNVDKINYKKLYENELKKNNALSKLISEKVEKIEELEKIIQSKTNDTFTSQKIKGQFCSISGGNYEKKVHNILKKCKINGEMFNTQSADELAGSSNKNDIECNFNGKKNIGIEVKKSKTPDWMQCCIKFDSNDRIWKVVPNSKHSALCMNIFAELICGLNLYDGEIPPFMNGPMTYEEWTKIKKYSRKWDDIYVDIPSDTITRLYKAKGCDYIQISDGVGLYHLGGDPCNFGVPLFNIEQQFRIRVKVHKTKNKKGFCSLSITVSCQPINIKSIEPSVHSLDCEHKLPQNLLYL